MTHDPPGEDCPRANRPDRPAVSRPRSNRCAVTGWKRQPFRSWGLSRRQARIALATSIKFISGSRK
ncbi:MAG TPA: hypothetical protein DIC59_02955 [Candidatus Competibacteraceae bacterium]|nr:hypothetical protein [Candidatus Competibacteraceae bacterium]